MVCVPAVFVVASVAADAPPVSIPEDCRERRIFCNLRWPLTIRIDRVLAARPSEFSAEETSSFQSGRTIQVQIAVHPSIYSKAVAPEDGQGGFSTPLLSDDDLTSLMRNQKFIFGLTDFGDRTSQIWSLSFQGTLENFLAEAARSGTPENQRQCPRLLN